MKIEKMKVIIKVVSNGCTYITTPKKNAFLGLENMSTYLEEIILYVESLEIPRL